jgi:hypothetical protein
MLDEMIQAVLALEKLLERRDKAIEKAQEREDYEAGYYERYDEMVADWNEDVVDAARLVVEARQKVRPL